MGGQLSWGISSLELFPHKKVNDKETSMGRKLSKELTSNY